MEIIIAEDEFMSRKFLKNMLEDQGHFVIEVRRAEKLGNVTIKTG